MRNKNLFTDKNNFMNNTKSKDFFHELNRVRHMVTDGEYQFFSDVA